jgi:hypothetical protein
MKVTFWHSGLRKDKWECLMHAGFYGSPGIAALPPDKQQQATKTAIVQQFVEPHRHKLSAAQHENIHALLDKLTC